MILIAALFNICTFAKSQSVEVLQDKYAKFALNRVKRVLTKYPLPREKENERSQTFRHLSIERMFLIFYPGDIDK